MDKTSLKMWLETARPKTLPLALASIVSGSALAKWNGSFSLPILLLSILTALLLQIVSNFANDYGDHLKGSDTAERIGPLRGIQHGVISPKQLKIGLILVILATLCCGSALILLATESWQDLIAFAVLGVVAVLASITYTIGRKPYGYLGLGDISVLIFFGWLGVGGSYYLQIHRLDFPVLMVATACGLLATAVLNINNLRDIEQDRKVGKNTLAVRLGDKPAKIYHCWLLACAMGLYLAFALLYFPHWFGALPILTFPLLIKHAWTVFHTEQPQQLRPMLAQMSLLALSVNLLFSAGLLLSSGFNW
ncbi:1,4-dihydroxy-2-naphthoate polyprenyltransferase [Testudinibacter sp. TR-2022]|uniref:1,4-dihydroxy-2-naphthoate polyprenyltransferase n=1 Tax=Testudinibacter sp. TR-2022 TaxID=2585029 RepID=UPI00111B8D97|nr:1,4-dihydroxy-2-naphthoate polyprenyltransferase [Testudinibacter sp. TR-2022]TNH09234.1 1,4-dihydroxy-2-naphthoate polyprenyltransferase [Pasteurellaceae bacterium Phil11]TNH25777.1 1,4-dihydroxy-2-naphthoate polyprenyltransferase [Testudinibacter sp. TR-2022]TNH28580.1 1,4-dihydroxy-2-naphthoate polyprenyltransferase [Testudinibacter sp. TR-2022]